MKDKRRFFNTCLIFNVKYSEVNSLLEMRYSYSANGCSVYPVWHLHIDEQSATSQYRVVSELIARGEIGFYLTIFGGSLPLLGRIIFTHWIAFICILLHYMLSLVSESEVMKRTGKFQAFRECLHNVAYIGYEFLTDFWQETVGKQGFKPQTRGQVCKGCKKGRC